MVHPLEMEANNVRVDRFIANPEGMEPAGGFQIDSAATTGTPLQHGRRMMFPDPIDQLIEPLNMTYLGNTTAVIGILLVPEGKRADVEVVTNVANVEFSNVSVQHVAHPLLNLRPAIVQ